MSRIGKTLASTAIAMALATGVWFATKQPAISGGETRTISLYHVHTKESLTITYMVDGRYVPSAMKKINHLLRDWRRNETITIDPKTIDLVWELHADLGSKAPISIVCGYRSPSTNKMLKRIGRNVARKSQHMTGRAIDLYFPDVPTIKIRNSALVRQVGGVGYYRSSGGPTGFLHVDSGTIRHWGPGISAREMASIMRDYRKTVGARLNRKDSVMVADSNSNSPSQQPKGWDKKNKIVVADGEDLNEEELADMSEKASRDSQKPRQKPAASGPDETVVAVEAVAPDVVPVPRPKPIEVLMMAAVSATDLKIVPASAPPPSQIKRNSLLDESIGVVEGSETMADVDEAAPVSNAAAKGSLVASIQDGTATDVPTIKTISASAAGSDLFWWQKQVIFDSEQAVRRDGAPQPFSENNNGLLPGTADAAEAPSIATLAAAATLEAAPGKGNLQQVIREGKGSLPTDMDYTGPKPQELGQLIQP